MSSSQSCLNLSASMSVWSCRMMHRSWDRSTMSTRMSLMQQDQSSSQLLVSLLLIIVKPNNTLFIILSGLVNSSQQRSSSSDSTFIKTFSASQRPSRSKVWNFTMPRCSLKIDALIWLTLLYKALMPKIKAESNPPRARSSLRLLLI